MVLISTWVVGGAIVHASEDHTLPFPSPTNDLAHPSSPVPTDDHGIIPEELEKCLQASHTHKSHPITPKRPFWAMLYLIPAFQNPTGSVLGRDRFQKIISLARQYNILVVCDDVYNLLYFAGMGAGPQDRLFAFDDP